LASNDFGKKQWIGAEGGTQSAAQASFRATPAPAARTMHKLSNVQIAEKTQNPLQPVSLGPGPTAHAKHPSSAETGRLLDAVVALWTEKSQLNLASPAAGSAGQRAEACDVQDLTPDDMW
jgi:hypothetical protein